MIAAQDPLSSPAASAVVATAAQVSSQLAVAVGLGTVVAVLYWVSRSAETRTRGFAHTLVLLAPLITMVTIAVGQNIAAAFTLVGTLAIVRFRAAVRDTRDMAFVIFAVAAGMASGSSNLVVASCGVAVIGGAVLVLRGLDRARPGREAAVLRLVISPPEPDRAVYAHVLAGYTATHAVVRSSVDRAAMTLDLRLAVTGLDPNRSPDLLCELLQVPDVLRASFAPEEIE